MLVPWTHGIHGHEVNHSMMRGEGMWKLCQKTLVVVAGLEPIWAALAGAALHFDLCCGKGGDEG